jgi:hypothetical protein
VRRLGPRLGLHPMSGGFDCSIPRGFAVSGVIMPGGPPPAFSTVRASIRVLPTLEQVFGYGDVNNYSLAGMDKQPDNITYVHLCLGVSNQAR